MKRGISYRYRKQSNCMMYVVVTVLIAVFCLTPLYYSLSTSLKPRGAEYMLPLELWPSKPTLQAYRAVLGVIDVAELESSSLSGMVLPAEQAKVVKSLNFLTPLRNSLIVSFSVAVFSLLISSLSAYAIARLRFKYKIQSLLFLQLGAMIPIAVTIAPTFMLMQSLGLLRTLLAMIIPNIFYNVPIATWLLACYFAELPFELEDAAKMDGYKPLKIYWRVILPLAAPGLFSAGVFAFLGSWGEFMLASAVTMGIPSVQTVPAAMLNFSVQFRYEWTWISAAIILSVVLVAFITFVFQRWVIRGLTAGAVKY
ncbi:MAG: carbohydrate ABC transporter permease [Chloroflexi bacterium]|nr:carbohydrate ABC transporter permease [Chloroflexota bacterium]MCL5075937.1 carbohydrate ABC transporter permease [Chloroflexota bacterium]